MDFEFFNFEPIDYKSVSNLLRQLLTHDADLFHIGALADFLVQDDNVLGSTVKCDDEGDPYAFCTLIDLASHATVCPWSLALLRSAADPGLRSIQPFPPFWPTCSLKAQTSQAQKLSIAFYNSAAPRTSP